MAKEPVAPKPGDPVGTILNYLTSAGDAAAAAWLRSNGSKLDPEVVSEIRGSLTLPGQSSPEAAEVVRGLAARNLEVDRDFPKIARDRVAQALGGGQISEDLNLDGQVDTEEKAAMAAERKRAAAASAAQSGVSTEEAQAGVDQKVNDALSIVDGYSPTPPLIGAYTSGLAPTDQQKQDLLDAYNEMTLEPVSSYEEFARIVTIRPDDPLVQSVVDDTLLGTTPTMMYEWKVRDRSSSNSMFDTTMKGPLYTTIRMDQARYDAMKATYGELFTNKDVKVLSDLASRTGVKDRLTGEPAWQVALAFANSLGIYEFDDGSEPVARSTSRAGAVSAAAKRSNLDGRNRMRVSNLLTRFERGKKMYDGNDAMAYVYVFRADLAAKMATTRIEDMDQGDIADVNGLFRKGRFSPEALAAMGYTALDWEGSNVNRPTSGSDPTGPIRQMPDPNAVRQTAKDMYRSLFAADPSDAQLEQLVAAVNTAVRGADADSSDGEVQDVNSNATLRSQLESLPEYRDLYGKKPGGMAELDYRNQFEGAANSMLGAQAADPNAVRSGMRSGQYQTTVGAVAGTKAARDNSTFMGRLAAAAQVVGENT